VAELSRPNAIQPEFNAIYPTEDAISSQSAVSTATVDVISSEVHAI